jgi:RimJ/RimL family protein N-acetyltransferase
MTDEILKGNLVELMPLSKEKDAELWANWNTDSDYKRLLDMDPAFLYPRKSIETWIEEGGDWGVDFAIHAIAEDKVIGDISLGGFDWAAGSAWVGIGIGEADFRGKGYGTDAMKVMLRYAFEELNLHRVSLDVFDFNPRAIKSYEKCGFKYEGTMRDFIYKEDKRWGILNMGVLRSEWLEMQS